MSSLLDVYFTHPISFIKDTTKGKRERTKPTVKATASTPAAHFKPPPTIPQAPLLEVRVKPPLASAVAVNVAQVPVVNQAPLLIRQPVCMPAAMVTSR